MRPLLLRTVLLLATVPLTFVLVLRGLFGGTGIASSLSPLLTANISYVAAAIYAFVAVHLNNVSANSSSVLTNSVSSPQAPVPTASSPAKMASATRLLDSVVVKSPLAVKPTALVLFLHGLGDSGHGWSAIGKQYIKSLPHVKFIFPHAPNMPITINGGMKMPGWYDIQSLGSIGERSFDHPGMKESASKVMQIIQEEIKSGIPENRIFIAGFSQGGAMSLYLSSFSGFKFAGVACLSGYLPDPEHALKNWNPINRDTPHTLFHGDDDQVVAYKYGKSTFTFLKEKLGLADVQFKTYQDLGHSADDEEINDLLSFLRKTLPPIESN